MLYLTQVLNEIKKESNPPKSLRAEHLFKLNEAVFNLSEEDAVDGPLAVKLFQAVEKIHTAYNTGKYDNQDSNFFYDYLALLGTMQNQHFFSQKQTEKMLGWIKEVVDTSGMLAAPSGGSSSKTLEVENEKLRKKLEKLEGAVQTIRNIETEPKGKNKTKAKAKEEPPVKASPGKKGKGKGKYDDYEEEPVVKGKGKGKAKKEKEVVKEVVAVAAKGKSKAKGEAKGKGKEKVPEPVKGKGKGKGKVKDDYEEPPKGKSKGKGKEGKGKSGKSKEEDPPLRKGKGKGKGKEEPKGKAKGKGKKGWKSK